jgi:hypothetical protein
MAEKRKCLPSGEDNEVGGEEATIYKSNTVLHKGVDDGIVFELDLAINEHLAGAHVSDNASIRKISERSDDLPK